MSKSRKKTVAKDKRQQIGDFRWDIRASLERRKRNGTPQKACGESVF
jgi:hypothetical protein